MAAGRRRVGCIGQPLKKPQLNEELWLLEGSDEETGFFLLDVTHIQASGATALKAVDVMAG